MAEKALRQRPVFVDESQKPSVEERQALADGLCELIRELVMDPKNGVRYTAERAEIELATVGGYRRFQAGPITEVKIEINPMWLSKPMIAAGFEYDEETGEVAEQLPPDPDEDGDCGCGGNK